MNIKQPFDPALIQNMGAGVIPPYQVSMPDFGINIRKPEPKVPKSLTSDECVKMFGAREP